MKDLAKFVNSKMPPTRKVELRCEADYYGISRQLADRLGYADVPQSRVAWQHGWGFGPITDPRQIIGEETDRDAFLVANESIAAMLQRHGLRGIAVGLPLVYVDQSNDEDAADRIPNSLLIMPAHASKQSKHSVCERDYVDSVLDKAQTFDHVLVCLSQQCYDKGYWCNTFREAGIDSVIGAGIDDGNALLRMRRLLSMFEVMTSNAIGSHFAYAGHCGCRLSLTEPLHRIAESDISNAPFYRSNPELISRVLHRTSKESITKLYPHLLADPVDSKAAKAWADEEIGVSCRLSDQQIASELQWNWWSRMKNKTRRSISKRLKPFSRQVSCSADAA
jgi:hypothetical protein